MAGLPAVSGYVSRRFLHKCPGRRLVLRPISWTLESGFLLNMVTGVGLLSQPGMLKLSRGQVA